MGNNHKTKEGAVSHLKAVSKRKLYEEIVTQILGLIEEGKLKPGDRIPTERELTEIFKVSRHSVREAIRSLEQKNVLASRPGSGTYVLSEDDRSLVKHFATAILKEKDKLAEIFTFRRMLEPQIAALAAKNACDEDFKIFDAILEKQKEKDIKSSDFTKLDNQFHCTIATATKNSVLQQIVESINDILIECRAEVYQSEKRIKLSLEGHTKILAAIRSGDESAAAELMIDHLRFVEEAIKDLE